MVLFIEYENKKYPVSVGYYALKHTNKELKDAGHSELDMASLMSGNIEVLEPLLYYSLVMGARLEKQELDVQRDDMEFMLNEVLFDFTKIIPEFFPTETSSEGKKSKK